MQILTAIVSLRSKSVILLTALAQNPYCLWHFSLRILTLLDPFSSESSLFFTTSHTESSFLLTSLAQNPFFAWPSRCESLLLLISRDQNPHFSSPLLRTFALRDPLAANPHFCWSLSLRIFTVLDLSCSESSLILNLLAQNLHSCWPLWVRILTGHKRTSDFSKTAHWNNMH